MASEGRAERVTEWRKNNPARNKANLKRWQSENAEYSKQYRKEYKRNLKIEVMTHYSGGVPRCACTMCPLPEKDIRFLTLDHVNGGGNEHRRKIGGSSKLLHWAKQNGYPPILQVLCADCNFAKGTNGGVCPHME